MLDENVELLDEVAELLLKQGDSYFASIAFGCLAWRAMEREDTVAAEEYTKTRDSLEIRGDWEQFMNMYKPHQKLRLLLTERELEVAIQAGERSNVDIARLLQISTRTVENHLHRAMRKLNVSNRQALAGVAMSLLGERTQPSKSR